MFHTSIFFLRHLKTNYNKNEIISGKEDSDILLGQQLIHLPSANIKFDTVLCSPLKRCRATISLFPNNMLEVKYMDELLERDMGVLEGVKRADAKTQYPYLFCGGKLDVAADIPNGESIREVQNRLEVIIDFIKKNQDKNILICSHNQTMKILYFSLNDISITNDAWQCLNFPNGVLINIGNLR